jgi:cytochrome c biogenesis protein CcmG, thiol:disulfide interchange protein DsbE
MTPFLRKFFTWGSMGFAFAVLAFFSLPHYRQGESSIAGKSAEDFALQLDGKPVHLSDLRGKVVVLNFWGSWCGPCVAEVPSLIALQQHLAPRNGVVLGVAADEDQAKYEQFLRDHGVNFPTYRDPGTNDDHRSPIAQNYGTSMYPETYVIDRKGKIARKIIGPQDWNSPEMTAYFDALLGQN